MPITGTTWGEAVAASANWVVAGAPDDADNGSEAGAVYVFAPTDSTKDDWQEVDKLLASDGASGDDLGSSVAVDGNIIVAGAPGEGSAGAAYVFEYDGANWNQGEEAGSFESFRRR